MRRIALCFCVVLLALAGCQGRPSRTRLGPAPAPILSTRAPRVVAPIAPPLRPKPRGSPTLPDVYAATVTPADISVPGGIRRSKWRIIVVHHSAAPSATPAGMHSYHKRIRGWSNGLGYHFVIGNGVKCPDGKLYPGPRWKKQQTGAHCKAKAGRYLGVWRPNNYFNEHGIGICLIGNFQEQQPTPKQLQTLKNLIRVLVRETDVMPGQVYGHGEVTHRTACPGRNLNMAALRSSL